LALEITSHRQCREGCCGNKKRVSHNDPRDSARQSAPNFLLMPLGEQPPQGPSPSPRFDRLYTLFGELEFWPMLSKILYVTSPRRSRTTSNVRLAVDDRRGVPKIVQIADNLDAHSGASLAGLVQLGGAIYQCWSTLLWRTHWRPMQTA
jgi:hypothetical protein